MSTLTGTTVLARLALRRDRVRLPVWLAGVTVLVATGAASVEALYPTPSDLEAFARTVEGNATVIALQGPPHGVDTLGGRVAFELVTQVAVVAALLNLFTVGRHTRTEEESGRTELVRAGVVGRHAPTAAALLVAGVADVALAGLVAAALAGQGLPAGGSILLGAAMASVGLVFAGAAAVASDVTEHARAAYGYTAAAVGAAFVVRAVGDVGDGRLSWLSPIGWAQATRPFAGNRWWPLLLSLAATAALVALTFALGSRRDVGAGLLAPRPGPPTASPRLARPFGLVVRLQRASLVAWSCGVLLLGVAYGSLGVTAEEIVGDNPDIRDFLAQTGGDLTDSFFATTSLMLALVAGGYAVQSALRARTEEVSGRAESVLATAVSRRRWAGSNLAMALLGTTVVLAAAGLGTGGAHAVRTGEPAEVLRLLGASLVHTPAAWVLVGLAVFVFGLAPRATAVVWAALVGVVVVGLFGELLRLPGWLRDVSPFHHVPRLPAADLDVVPLVALTAVAAALAVAGVAGYRRRDVT